MDRLNAHLDRGWDLLQKGDTRGARSSARRALELDADSPDAHNLLGHAAERDGEVDEALEHYRQAMALDDGFVDPMLAAAELLLHPLQAYAEAIDLCDEILSFAESTDDIADALLLKFDAMLGLEAPPAELRRVLAAVPEGPFENPAIVYHAGRAWFELGELDAAEGLLRKAIADEPTNPDGHYYLGLVREQRGDWRGAAVAFLESRELDLNLPQPPWALPRAEFHKVLVKALDQVPPELSAPLDGALVLSTEAPGMEMVADGVDPRQPVLIEGLAPGGVPAVPGALVRVFVYQRNVERLVASLDDLESELVAQLQDELERVVVGDPATALEGGVSAAAPTRLALVAPLVPEASETPDPAIPVLREDEPRPRRPRKKD